MPTARRQRTLMVNPTPRLIAWYDAGTLALADTNAVPAWEDTTRLSTGVAQGTGANQPLYKHNGTDDINGLPVVEFDGTNDVLSTAIPFNLGNAFTIFMVARSDTSLNGRGYFTLKNATSRGICLQLNGTGFLYYENGATIYNAFNAGYISNSTPFLLTLVKKGAVVKTYTNGVLRRTDIGQPEIGSAGGATFFIGAGANGTSEYMTKHIAELRFYHGAMSDAQRQSEELKLNTKYALF